MYNTRQIIKGLRHPEYIPWEVVWLYQRKLQDNSGINVMLQDWDNLIILDACRYDLFKELNSIDGNLKPVISKGSSTAEFLNRSFSTGTYKDTVYISANPKVKKHNIDRQFHDRIRLWESNWNEELKTVPPKPVVRRALDAEKEYPNKRLIIHFLQPHYPFIGKRGQRLEYESVLSNEGGAIIWDQLRRGEVEKEEVWEAYKENLELTLPHIQVLKDSLEGKVVVTSDHGNAFGEWNIYGHPSRKYTESLVKVPWLEIESDFRKDIQKGTIMEADSDTPSNEVQERLSDLGYR